jgi:branched-chain amino acid transport system substrate-binding protein
LKRNNWLKVLSTILMSLVITSLLLGIGCPSDDNGDNGTTPTPTETKDPLKVGIMVPETGVAASKGRPMSAGVQDAIKYINEELDGVDGHQIDAIVRDNGYNAASATTIINEFISSEVLLFTTQSSAMMTAAMGIANEEGLPGFAVFSSPAITQPPQHIFGQMPDYGDAWAAFAAYYLENIWEGTGKPKMALHLLNNSTGDGARQAALAKAEELGIEIIAIEEHTSTTANEIESLTRIRALNPDVIYISSTPPPTSIIVKDAVTLGMYPGITIGCGHASFTSEFVTLAGANADGVYGVFPTVSWGDEVPAMAKMTEYANNYHPEFADNMDYITAWAEGLIIAEVLRLAIQNAPVGANDLTAEYVEQYGFKMFNGFDVGGLHGPVTYTDGDNRLSKSLRVFQVQNGEIQAVSDWTDAPLIDYS